jgi:hypothetical protein
VTVFVLVEILNLLAPENRNLTQRNVVAVYSSYAACATDLARLQQLDRLHHEPLDCIKMPVRTQSMQP